MEIGARTPEELEELLEDAFILGDERALAALFEPHAVVAVEGRLVEARTEKVAAALAGVWNGSTSHALGPQHVVQAGRTALLVADHAITVMRRTPHGCWRYAIALFANNEKEIPDERDDSRKGEARGSDRREGGVPREHRRALHDRRV